MSIYRGKTGREFYLSSLLYDSIEDNNLRGVKSLLTEKGADPNIVLPKKGISPFHLAIGCDSDTFTIKVTRLILQHGGNPNVRSDDGLTPVHIASAWGRLEILQLLLSCGGDPEARDLNNMTPLRYAKKEDHVECLELLKRHLPDQSHLIKREKEDCVCNLELDKVLVNNGQTVGEYRQLQDSINQQPQQPVVVVAPDLHQLPRANPNEYVMDWFRSHVDETGGKTYVKLPQSSCASSEDSFLSFESSMDESDNQSIKKQNPHNLTFRKIYTKRRKIAKSAEVATKACSASSALLQPKQLEFSTSSEAAELLESLAANAELVSSESGIVTLPNSNRDSVDSKADAADANGQFRAPSSFTSSPHAGARKTSTSDYLTCSLDSLLNKNVFEISEDLMKTCVGDESKAKSDVVSTDLSFVSVSEVYKYEDAEEGVVLYEKRLLKAPSECNGSIQTAACSLSSKMSSLPETFQYDNDTLRKELTQFGYNPGPITVTTKRVYLKKLYQLKKCSPVVTNVMQITSKRAYSHELEKTIRNPNWVTDLELYKTLEADVSKEFCNPDPARKWREGVTKSSFAYLLLDPRRTCNLPGRADSLRPHEVWETFLSAIFYVGKGKRSRPYSHLYDAVSLWKRGRYTSDNDKLQKILDIWQNDGGVICLHVFQNIIPVEAYTREAAMICALKIENVSNVKSGEFYGVAATWPQRQKKMYGTYLLYRAMMIFVHEGERQLYPNDIN